jgi:hypothetical protein
VIKNLFSCLTWRQSSGSPIPDKPSSNNRSASYPYVFKSATWGSTQVLVEFNFHFPEALKGNISSSLVNSAAYAIAAFTSSIFKGG